MTPIEQGSALISWSGSMFEYLMPALVMRSPPGSLLEQTNLLVVRRQVRYGATRGVPWGVSESAFNARDLELTYQYSNFGVPGLGLKRGLSEDLVIAPYATALAAMVAPGVAAENLERLAGVGARGAYGFYEALDYTATRLPAGSACGLVRAYMAHHQGMSVVAIANVLCDGAMRARFHADPVVKAADLLLQERAPRDVAVSRPRAEEVKTAAQVRDPFGQVARRFTSPHDVVPRTHLLSNGKYVVMITAAGSGYSRWQDIAVTRWREDSTRDAYGQYIFVRDAATGEVWSAGYQPCGVEADAYEAIFSEDRAEIRRRDGAITTTLEVVVSPEDDAELRRVTVTNLGGRPREIELTSYAEVVLAPPAADAAHPAFSNLFVQTEADHARNALVATRRPRSPEEAPVWAAHVVGGGRASIEGDVQFETDRARFLGRGRSIRTPMSVIDGRPLSNTAGSVLDPIFSLRRRVRLPAGATRAHHVLDVVGRVARSRRRSRRQVRGSVGLRARGDARPDPGADAAPPPGHRARRGAPLPAPGEPHPLLGLHVAALVRGAASRQRRRGGLWPYGISGDLPIVLVRIDDVRRSGDRPSAAARARVLAAEAARRRPRDPERAGGLVRAGPARRPGRRCVRATRSLLAARGSNNPGGGSSSSAANGCRSRIGSCCRPLPERCCSAGTVRLPSNRAGRTRSPPSHRRGSCRRAGTPSTPEAPPARPELEFFNGLGGFAAEAGST